MAHLADCRWLCQEEKETKKQPETDTNRSHVYDMTYIVNVRLSSYLLLFSLNCCVCMRMLMHIYCTWQMKILASSLYSLVSLVSCAHATLSSYFASFSLPVVLCVPAHMRIDSEQNNEIMPNALTKRIRSMAERQKRVFREAKRHRRGQANAYNILFCLTTHAFEFFFLCENGHNGDRF